MNEHGIKTDLRVTDFLSQEELLLQLAEEASELAQASLKLRRVLNGQNPTPIGYQQAVKQFNEEIADVQLCLDMISFENSETIRKVYHAKHERWLSRLIENRAEEERRK